MFYQVDVLPVDTSVLDTTRALNRFAQVAHKINPLHELTYRSDHELYEGDIVVVPFGPVRRKLGRVVGPSSQDTVEELQACEVVFKDIIERIEL